MALTALAYTDRADTLPRLETAGRGVDNVLPMDRSLQRLREAARLNPIEVEKSSTEMSVRAERLQCLEQLPRLHTWCVPEDPQQEYDSWETTLARVESDELLCLLDLTAAECNTALEESRPFHFSAHLCALVMDWAHWMLADTDSTSPRASQLRKTFDACHALFTALVQEADAVAASY